MSTGGIASVAERTNGEMTQRIEDELASTVSLAGADVQGLTVSLADTSVVVPQAVTSGSIGSTVGFLEEGVLTLLLALVGDVETARFDSAFETSVDGVAVRRALEAAFIPDAFNISITHILVHPAIIALLLAVGVVESTSLADEVAFFLGVTASARSNARVLDDVPHAFRVEVARVGSDPAEFASLCALARRSKLAIRIAVAGDVRGNSFSRVVLAAAAADVEDTVPFAHGAGRAGRRFRGPVAGFVTDIGLRVPFAVGVSTA